MFVNELLHYDTGFAWSWVAIFPSENVRSSIWELIFLHPDSLMASVLIVQEEKSMDS